MLERGVDIAAVANIAKHSRVDTTRRYDRRPEETKKKRRAAALSILKSILLCPAKYPVYAIIWAWRKITRCCGMSEQTNVEETWVSTTEGSEITGYNAEYLKKLARKEFLKPENERLIKVRNRSNRYELWLPDLVEYMTKHGYGSLEYRRSTT